MSKILFISRITCNGRMLKILICMTYLFFCTVVQLTALFWKRSKRWISVQRLKNRIKRLIVYVIVLFFPIHLLLTCVPLKITSTHLSNASFMLFRLAQLSFSSTFFCTGHSVLFTSTTLIWPGKNVSEKSNWSYRSFMNIQNGRDPWGTPLMTSKNLELVFCFLSFFIYFTKSCFLFPDSWQSFKYTTYNSGFHQLLL